MGPIFVKVCPASVATEATRGTIVSLNLGGHTFFVAVVWLSSWLGSQGSQEEVVEGPPYDNYILLGDVSGDPTRRG